MEAGFGFQHHPQKYDKLMTEGLGYQRYGIEGGDWGGFITAPYGFLCPENLIGIHLNCLFPRLGDEREPEDKDPNILRGLGMKWHLSSPLTLICFGIGQTSSVIGLMKELIVTNR